MSIEARTRPSANRQLPTLFQASLQFGRATLINRDIAAFSRLVIFTLNIVRKLVIFALSTRIYLCNM